jgi:hypothetical protein
VVNAREEPIEVIQEISIPALVRRDFILWGYTWYMQTPLENIGDDFSIIFRFIHGLANINIELAPVCRYRLDKSILNTGIVRFIFHSPKSSDRHSVTKKIVNDGKEHPEGPLEGTIDGEIEITKFFREINLEKMN